MLEYGEQSLRTLLDSGRLQESANPNPCPNPNRNPNHNPYANPNPDPNLNPNQESECRTLTERLLQLVRHLHSRGVVHTDLRAEHVFLLDGELGLGRGLGQGLGLDPDPNPNPNPTPNPNPNPDPNPNPNLT